MARPPHDNTAPQSAGTGFTPDEITPESGALATGDAISAPDASSFWHRKLRRVTSSGRFIPEVDGLRFVAIMHVVLFHIFAEMVNSQRRPFTESPFSAAFTSVLSHGGIGVQLFFTISGFILALPFANHCLKSAPTVSLRSYYLRRLTRLEPPYLIVLLAIFLWITLAGRGSISNPFAHLLASVFYLHNLIFGEGSVINYVAWSLEIEVQFYLLAPFFALIFRVKSASLRRLILLALLCLLVALQTVYPHSPRLKLSLLGQGQFFVVGFLLADLYLTDWAKTASNTKAWDIAFFMGWPLLILVLQNDEIAHWIVPSLVFIIYAATFRGKWGRQLLSLPVLTIIGGMCYSIYLIHYRVLALVWRYSHKASMGSDFAPNFLFQVLLIVPIILLISVLFYLLVERPCMNRHWPRQLLVRARAMRIRQ